MTAPGRPDLGALDELTRLHAAATPGPWENPYPFTKLIDAPGSTDNMAIVQCDNAADAALIVAAVNALPRLVAAVRAGFDYADEQKVPYLRAAIRAALSGEAHREGNGDA